MASGTLAERIKAEFDARDQRAKSAQAERDRAAQEHEQGMTKFGKVCEELAAIWKPRLEEFAQQFGKNIRVTPTVKPAYRKAEMAILSDLANITLTLTASPSSDATKIAIDYDLLIIPMFFDYERHARLERPLDKVDKNAVGAWIDDRLVSCVKAYLSIQENQAYLARAMVEDPISKTKLLKHDAAATLDHNGTTVYFSSQDSLKAYKEKHQITK